MTLGCPTEGIARLVGKLLNGYQKALTLLKENNIWKRRASCHFQKEGTLESELLPAPQTSQWLTWDSVRQPSGLRTVMLLSNTVVIHTPFPPNRDVKLCKRWAFQNGFLLDRKTLVGRSGNAEPSKVASRATFVKAPSQPPRGHEILALPWKSDLLWAHRSVWDKIHQTNRQGFVPPPRPPIAEESVPMLEKKEMPALLWGRLSLLLPRRSVHSWCP